MPRQTGYERLTQADDSDSDTHPSYAPITKPSSSSSRRRRHRANSTVDIKAINARLERWADEIASKFKRRRPSNAAEEDRLEIQHSVFRAPDGVRPLTQRELAELPPAGAMTDAEFEVVVESVRAAIRQQVHPSMISQGSSGSYFARNPDGKIVGVFKPKDEEPYAAGNPKWNKWIHRNLFPCFFGRACLIPNLSYVSEAAAYVLDLHLRTNLVPYTAVVNLSSKSFHYPYLARRAFYRKKKPFPAKPGSFQVFLKGFKDANVFLRENPWPDQYWAGFRGDSSGRRRKKKTWTESCRPSTSGTVDLEAGQVDDDDESDEETEDGQERFRWTDALKQSFREELEKLVVLDYIMRNTDRGLDNWMVKVDWETGQVSIASDAVRLNMDTEEETGHSEEDRPRPVDAEDLPTMPATASYPYAKQRPMQAASGIRPREPTMALGAIDNSLSWPWKHPDAWRSYPFGWLFLPVDLIGRPFSQKTRDHFLPLLTSTAWWSETQTALKRVFQIDEDFQERMFAKQIAVMKGQAWNVVEALKSPDHGPLELTRRAKVCVWDDLVDVPVAVPMRATSSEVRRQSESHPRPSRPSIDELDIASSLPPTKTADLLALEAEEGEAPGPADMPHPGRFEIGSPNDDASLSPTLVAADVHHRSERPKLNVYEPERGTPRQQRRYSFAPGPARRNSNSIAAQLYDDGDVDGDLGYAAAEGQIGQQRKVIIERLEPVKARNPVFTWC